MIKNITLNIKIVHENGEIKKHNWKISGFMHRRLTIVRNRKFDFRTATQIRDWFMQLLQGVIIE